MTDLHVRRRCKSLTTLRLALVVAAACCGLPPAGAQLRVGPAERAAQRPQQGPAESVDDRAADRAATAAADRSVTRPGDYIVAIVNQELVTAIEVERRMQRAREEVARGRGARLPPEDELRRQIVEALIEERVILTYTREAGMRIDDTELDRAVQAIAAQNQMTVEQLRARLRAEGIEFARFRSNLRDQMLVERTREREVYQRIRVTDAEIDRFIDERRQSTSGDTEINLAQVLVAVPEGADAAVLAGRRARAEEALTRVRRGEPFDMVARELSDDASRTRGGELGPRPAARLPDLFLDAIKGLKSGDVVPEVLRSGAGFHVLKVIAAGDAAAPRVPQARVRHILLRPSPQLSAEQAQARLAAYRRAIENNSSTFEDLARRYSEDGSAGQGGDLGWASPGMMVPEFEQAMNRLPVGGLSAPVASRFGWHLIQVTDRRTVEIEPRQLREQARNALREQKFEDAYQEWVKDLRARAYVEMREPPA
jgi:peptidyl-prolyl cis-trans isomerase SurA